MNECVMQLRAELKERDIAGLTAQLDQLEHEKHRQAGQIESLAETLTDPSQLGLGLGL